MISVEECKEYLHDLNLDDSKVEEIRDLLEAFIEQALDFAFNPDIIADIKQNEKSKQQQSN